jgi:N6-adenosine-specific RNA methylase IME4
MTDDEMRAMPIPALQDEGLLFLWVTGRAMEVGRECLKVWGYTRIDEVIWVKTNQVCVPPFLHTTFSEGSRSFNASSVRGAPGTG